ncbi:unnamed protein product [Alopecurus aequalis]
MANMPIDTRQLVPRGFQILHVPGRTKSRILAKLKVIELEDIPKSIRYTESESPEAESWTCSVEVFHATLLGGGPADEDPVPDEGVDPHPLPVVPPFAPAAGPPQDDNDGDVEDNGWGHWVLQGPPVVPNNAPILQNMANQNMVLDAPGMAIEAEELPPNLQQEFPINSSLTAVTDSAGAHSNNGDNSANSNDAAGLGEVNQLQNVPANIELENLMALDNAFADAGLGDGLSRIISAYLEPEEDILSDDDSNMLVDDNSGNIFVEPALAHIQLGMVQTFTFPMEQCDVPSMLVSKKGMELWEKYFAPHMHGASSNFSDPVSWFNFVTMLLLTQEKFDWTKSFLKSPLWNLVKNVDNDFHSFDFSIPENCVMSQAPACKLLEMPTETEGASTDLDGLAEKDGPKRKRRGEGPLVEDEVRRSTRLQEINNGFKNNPCISSACLPCNARPPSFNNKLVRNLASSFCKVVEEELVEKLEKKSKKKDGAQVNGYAKEKTEGKKKPSGKNK